MTKTGSQILSEVSDITRRIDQLDNPELSYEDLFKQMNCLTELLSRDYMSAFPSKEIIAQMESLSRLLESEKCCTLKCTDVIYHMETLLKIMKTNTYEDAKGKDILRHIASITNLLSKEISADSEKIANCVLNTSNSLIELIAEDKDVDLSTENVLHKISRLTRLLPKSKNKMADNRTITDLKFLAELRKIRSLLFRPEVEITTHLIVQEIKEMILVLEKSNNTSLTQEGKPIMDAMKSLRRMLEGEKIQISTTQLLFEIRGITNILSRQDLEEPSSQDQLKIFGSIANLRKRISRVNSQCTDGNESRRAERILAEVNGLIGLLDTDNQTYEFDNISCELRLQ